MNLKLLIVRILNVIDMKITQFLWMPLLLLTLVAYAQTDVVVGTTYPLNIQRQNTLNDAFILHNAAYSTSTDLLAWGTTHSSFGMRGIRFSNSGGIYFYANNSATTAASTFLPITRFYIGNNGNVGVGTTAPAGKLHLSGGDLVLDNGTTPAIATGTGSAELGRYLRITNATGLATPAGLKTGGLLVADNFTYASPGKNDLVIAGRVGIGTAISSSNTYALDVKGTLHATGLYVNNQPYISSPWTTAGSNVYYGGAVGVGTTLTSNPNGYALVVGGTLNTTGGLYVNDELFVSSQWTRSSSALVYHGTVGIGTALTSNPNGYVLAVNGKIGAKDLHVENSSAAWPDYVFEDDYALPPLTQVQTYIVRHKHLPDVPDANTVEKEGYDVSAMDAVMLQKIEELTLYILQQQQEIDALKEQLANNPHTRN